MLLNNNKNKDCTQKNKHGAKRICIRRFSGPYFPEFGINTEMYFRIQSEFRKKLIRKPHKMSGFYAITAPLQKFFQLTLESTPSKNKVSSLVWYK